MSEAQSPIITPRLILRQIKPEEDAKDVFEFMSVPSVMTYTYISSLPILVRILNSQIL